MIKAERRDALHAAGFQHITGLTKPQVRALLTDDTIAVELFDEHLREVQTAGQRYLLRRELERVWKGMDCTVEEGLESLGTLCCHDLVTDKGITVNVVPKPRALNRKLLKALSVSDPPSLPKKATLKVDTHKRRPQRRK